MQRKDTRKAFFQITTLNNGVDEAMLKRKLCRLESFGQRLFDGVLDYTTASKTDKRMGLGNNDVALHGERSRYATCGGIGDNRYIQQTRTTVTLDCGADLTHLHQGHKTLLHTGTTRCSEDKQGQALIGSPLDRAGYLLAYNRPHRTHHEGRFHDAKRHFAAIELNFSGAHALIKAATHALLFNKLVELGELKRIAFVHGSVPFFE